MTNELPETIRLSKTILSRVHQGSVAGHSYVNERNQWVLQLGLSDLSGRRGIDVVEGDTLEFAGVKWKVSKVYEPSTAPRGRLAELTRVSEAGSSGIQP